MEMLERQFQRMKKQPVCQWSKFRSAPGSWGGTFPGWKSISELMRPRLGSYIAVAIQHIAIDRTNGENLLRVAGINVSSGP